MIDIPFTDDGFLDDIAANVLIVARGGGPVSPTLIAVAEGYKAAKREGMDLPEFMFASLLGVLGALGNDPEIGQRLADHIQEFWAVESMRMTVESN